MRTRQVHPKEIRDGVIDLMWDHRHWPGKSRGDYERVWEWRYTGLGDGEPVAWVVDDGQGRILAHLGGFPRRYRLGNHHVNTLVPGDILVRTEHRQSLLGLSLFRKVITQVRKGEIDLLLMFTNEDAYQVVSRMGLTDIGGFHEHLDLRRSSKGLGRRYRPAAFAAPIADAYLTCRRWWYQRERLRAVDRRGLRVEPIKTAELSRIDRSHWEYAPDYLTADDSRDFIDRRFLSDPHSWRQIYGIFDAGGERMEGYVIVGYKYERASVDDCQTNSAVLEPADAIALVARRQPQSISTFSVISIAGSALDPKLRSLGMHRRPSGALRSLHVVAVWNQRHPAAEALGRPSAWTLYRGATEL